MTETSTNCDLIAIIKSQLTSKKFPVDRIKMIHLLNPRREEVSYLWQTIKIYYRSWIISFLEYKM